MNHDELLIKALKQSYPEILDAISFENNRDYNLIWHIFNFIDYPKHRRMYHDYRYVINFIENNYDEISLKML